MRKLELDRQVALGFGLAMFVLVAVGSASYLTVSHFIGASRLAVRNAEIVTPLQRVLALAYEAETSQRGFLVSGGQSYLEQRDRAMSETRQALRELRELVQGDAALLARVDKLASIADARFRLFEEVLRAREEAGDGSRELLARGLGREEMATLAREVNRLAAERHALLRADSDAARNAGQRVFMAFFVALAVVVGLLLYILRLILRQIAARQEAFRDLAQSQARQVELVHELKSANEELASFAYVASHDLKAPLRAIASLAQWISADQAPKFDDEGREQMTLLLGRVKRMDRLIDGILEYSRVGRVKEARRRVDLNALVAETVDLLAPPANVSVEVGPLPTLVIERTRAQQVFQNLIGNALQYLDKPQGRIRVDCRADGGDWHFRVEDNGPGIEERHFDRIFQMFQSLTARDKKESTGIGLTLVKKIVEMHGGRIWVESKMGAGSTFHFTLARSAVSAS
ncbi:MAG: ATP-binding protein [Burkholderiaceae bacterium]|nr:ATP-binding protein [Burkholderiaceae bacterium]